MREKWKNQPPQPTTEQRRPPEHWTAPTIEEMQAKENSFTDYARLVSNVLQLQLLALSAYKKEYPGNNRGFDFMDCKDFLQNPLTPDKAFVQALTESGQLYDTMEGQRKGVRYSPQEIARTTQAIEAFRAIPICQMPARGHQSGHDDWVPTTPKISTAGNGISLTNIYRDPRTNRMTIEEPEQREFRVNLGLQWKVPNRRVLQDLYDRFLRSPVLQQVGFRMKSLGGNRTDSIIVYCGPRGAQAATEIMGNYCIEENIADMPGIAFGHRPLSVQGKIMNMLGVTINPPNKATFNDLQAQALNAAFIDYSQTRLSAEFPGVTAETATAGQLRWLLDIVRHERAATLALELQPTYETAIRERLGIPDTEQSIWNVAFPTVAAPDFEE